MMNAFFTLPKFRSLGSGKLLEGCHLMHSFSVGRCDLYDAGCIVGRILINAQLYTIVQVREVCSHAPRRRNDDQAYVAATYGARNIDVSGTRRQGANDATTRTSYLYINRAMSLRS